MRMILLVALIGAATGAGVAAAPPAGIGQPSHCPGDASKHWAGKGKPGTFHKLTDLPPARAYYPMVERGAYGCILPVLCGTRRGGPPPPWGRRAPITPRTFP